MASRTPRYIGEASAFIAVVPKFRTGRTLRHIGIMSLYSAIT